jgi:uncharacterized RDD family membrane protein YckC
MDPTERVCPECGQSAGSQPFCAACGKNLSGLDRLPSREEWERQQAPPAPATNLWASAGPESPTNAPARPSYAMPEQPSADSATPVAAEPPRAAWGYRVGAWLVDAGVAIALGLGTELVLSPSSGSDAWEGVGGLVIIAAWVLVTAGMSGITGGQSLGKWIAGVRVIHGGEGAGFWRIFLRDTVCGLLYAVPVFFVVNACFPLSSERRSVIDRIVGTDVVQTASIKGRVPALVAAAVLAIGAWVGLAAAGGGFDDDHYTRAEFVADCTDGGGDGSRCGCIYDRMDEQMSRDDLDAFQTVDKADDIFVGAQAILDDAISACE